MARSRKVALLIETSNAYARGLLHGIDVYVREHEPWFFYLAEHSRGDRAPSWLPTWDGHGVIARVENKAIAQTLARMKIPVVDVSAAVLLPTLPFVETHDVEVARLAADHFFGRGFRKFAYC
ncbi:MAG: xylose operon transcription regulator XylR, partial [Verrucomicrobiota bacterium]